MLQQTIRSGWCSFHSHCHKYISCSSPLMHAAYFLFIKFGVVCLVVDGNSLAAFWICNACLADHHTSEGDMAMAESIISVIVDKWILMNFYSWMFIHLKCYVLLCVDYVACVHQYWLMVIFTFLSFSLTFSLTMPWKSAYIVWTSSSNEFLIILYWKKKIAANNPRARFGWFYQPRICKFQLSKKNIIQIATRIWFFFVRFLWHLNLVMANWMENIMYGR